MNNIVKSWPNAPVLFFNMLSSRVVNFSHVFIDYTLTDREDANSLWDVKKRKPIIHWICLVVTVFAAAWTVEAMVDNWAILFTLTNASEVCDVT